MAKVNVLEGYSYSFCLHCEVNGGSYQNVNRDFDPIIISQTMGCLNYLTPITAVTKTMAFQGDPMLD